MDGPLPDGVVDGEDEVGEGDGREEKVKGGIEAGVAFEGLGGGHGGMIHRLALKDGWSEAGRCGAGAADWSSFGYGRGMLDRGESGGGGGGEYVSVFHLEPKDVAGERCEGR